MFSKVGCCQQHQQPQSVPPKDARFSPKPQAPNLLAYTTQSQAQAVQPPTTHDGFCSHVQPRTSSTDRRSVNVAEKQCSAEPLSLLALLCNFDSPQQPSHFATDAVGPCHHCQMGVSPSTTIYNALHNPTGCAAECSRLVKQSAGNRMS